MIYRSGNEEARRERLLRRGQSNLAQSPFSEHDSMVRRVGFNLTGRQAVPGLTDEEAARIVSSIREAVPAKEIYVFGSRARGDYGPDSDVDIFIVADDDSNWAHARAREALSWLKLPKDVLVESEELYREGASRFGYVEREVANEGVKLYG